VGQRQLHVLLHRRRNEPQRGKWAIPGVFVNYPRREEDEVMRALKEKTGLGVEPYVEHLDWWSEPKRDPRGWVVTHLFLALVPFDVALENLDPGCEARLVPVFVPWPGETGGPVDVPPSPISRFAFDHRELIGLAVKRLRGKVRYSAIALELMPETFTLRGLQDVYEAILNERLNRATFQKLVVEDLGIVEPTGQYEPPGVGRRRAQMFRRRSS
jgi:8-oxo-dGTP diphosphatase